MNIYEVRIDESRCRIVAIEAESEMKAQEKVQAMYVKGEIALVIEDEGDTFFEVV